MPERITRDDVIHVARLANLALSDDEITTATEELGAVLAHAADVEALDLDDHLVAIGQQLWRCAVHADAPGRAGADQVAG